MQKTLKQLSIILIISILISSTCGRTSDDSDVNEFLLSFIRNDTKQDDNEQGGGVQVDYELKQCSANKLLDKFAQLVVPHDYEEASREEVTAEVGHMNETVKRLDRLQTWINNITTRLDDLTSRVVMRVAEQAMLVDIPADCRNALTRIADGIQNKESWAMQYLNTFDISEKIGNNGLLMLTKVDYDECLDFESPATDDNRPRITGQYCPFAVPDLMPKNITDEVNKLNDTVLKMAFSNTNVKMELPNDLPRENNGIVFNKNMLLEIVDLWQWQKRADIKMPVSVCFPRQCSAKDVEQLMNQALYPIMRFPVAIDQDCLYKGKPVQLTKHQFFAVLFYGSLFAMVVFSTIAVTISSSFPKRIPGSFMAIARCFSLKHNLRAIYRPRKANKYSFFDGVRTFLSIHVVNLHEIETGLFRGNSRRVDRSVFNDRTSPFKYFMEKNLNFIDIFFMLGGLGAMEETFKLIELGKGKFNYVQFVLFRYLRLAPGLMGTIVLFYLFPLTGDGPLWRSTSKIFYTHCTDNWWTSATMTSNIFLFRTETLPCNISTWYMSADFQLRLLSPIIILVMYKYRKVAIGWCLAWISVSAFVPLIIRVFYHQRFILETWRKDSIWSVGDAFVLHYNRAETHISPYVMGILLGYLINTHPKAYLGGRLGESGIWLMTWFITFAMMIWNNMLWMWDYELGYTELLVYLVTIRPLHLAGWFWLVYACATGRGGFINRFFSWTGFTSTSNLSFEVMLTQLLVILYRVGSSRSLVTHTLYNTLTLMCADYLFTYLFALLFNLVLSGPFARLFSLFVKSKVAKSRKDVKSTS